jgi:peptide/nickel transport system substrate-binding protein
MQRERAIKSLLLAFILLFTSGTMFPASSAAGLSVFSMTLVGVPNSLNCLTAVTGNAAYYITFLEYNGISVYLPNGTLDLTQSIISSFSHNGNYTEWTFHIKPGLKWSNGSNVTAQDLVETMGTDWQDNPLYNYWGLAQEITNGTVVNSTTAVFDLNVSDAQLVNKTPSNLFCPIYPTSLIKSQGPSTGNFGTDISDGPFYVYNYSQGETQMLLLRNPYYAPAPRISEIQVNFAETLSLTATSLLSGHSDLAPIDPSDAKSILTDPNLGILDQKGLGITTLQYNVTQYPYNMSQFRQALVYGINQSEIASFAFNGYASTAYSAQGIVYPGAIEWYNPDINKYEYNQTEALQLLSSMGINKGSDGFLHYPNGTIATLTLWTDSDQTPDVTGAGIVQQNLQQLGFQVKLITTTGTNIVADYSSDADNIQSAMIYYTAPIAPVWGDPYQDARTGPEVYWLPVTSFQNWESPQSANQEYFSNRTALYATDNVTLERMYLNNIQALNAKYLPTVVLCFPDLLFGYNKADWTNWPTNGYIMFQGGVWNWTALSMLSPTTSSSSTTASGISSTISAISSSSVSPNIIYVAAAVIIVVIVVMGGFAVWRTRRT